MTMDLAKLRAETLALIAQEDCDWCVDGLQADGETPCPCRLGATFPAADTLRLLDEIERLKRALVEAAIPLEAMILAAQDDIAGRRLYGELLWNGIVAGVEAVRTALAEGGPDDR